MRAVHFILYSSFPCYSGGRENWLYHVGKELVQRGYMVYVYSLESDRAVFYEDLEKSTGIRVFSVSSLQRSSITFHRLNRVLVGFPLVLDALWLFPRRVGRTLRENLESGEVLVAMGPLTELMAALNAVRGSESRQKVVCSVRGLVVQEYASVAPWSSPLLRWLELRNMAQSDLLLANGYDTAAYLRKLGFESQVVPNGVSTAMFAAPRTDDPELADLASFRAQGVLIILVVGTLRRIKGVEEAIRAAPYLKERLGRPFCIVFVGKGNPKRLQGLARKLHVERHVHFLGERRNIAGCLNLADVVLSVSLGAGMSMSTLEAMAAGRPIVAWRHPIYTQLIDDGKTGLLVDTANSAALAAAVEQIVANPSLAAQLGQEAQATVRAYDWSRVVDRLEHLISCLY
ncbi:MAG TPA: glycosyltransferase [Anaerolineae bacterium]|nr:glycosyltransferase [Anaerolineae bacterium]